MSSRLSSTSSSNRVRRFAGAGAAAALAVAGLGAFSPAGAASAPLNYACAVPILGAQNFVTTHSVASTVPVGGAVPISSSVVVPEGLVGQLRTLLGGKSVAGTVDGAATASGAPVTYVQKLAATPVPASGPMTVVAAGAVPVPASLPVGSTLDVVAGNYTPNLLITKTDGTTVGPLAAPCTLEDGQDAAVGTVTVVKTTSTTKIVAKGGKKKATITVTVKPGTKVAATGKVKVTVSKGKKKVTKNLTLKSGKASFVAKKLKKGKYRVSAVYAGDKNVKGSKGTASVKVK